MRMISTMVILLSKLQNVFPKGHKGTAVCRRMQQRKNIAPHLPKFFLPENKSCTFCTQCTRKHSCFDY